jgi:hypothetical protein
MQYLIKYKMTILGITVGAGLGYAYWWFVGCASGTCPITSSPVNSSLYGAFVGGVLFHGFGTGE